MHHSTNQAIDTKKLYEAWVSHYIVQDTARGNHLSMHHIPFHGPLTTYVKLRVAHAPGMPGRFPRHRLQRKPLVSDPGLHRDACWDR